MKKHYNKGTLVSKIFNGVKKIVNKKPKPTCQASGCYNLCASRKDVYCTRCIKYPPPVQNIYIPPVTVNPTPPPSLVTVAQPAVNQPIVTAKLTTPPPPPVTVNPTPPLPVNVNQPIVTSKSTTPPPPKLNQIFSNSVIKKTEMKLLKTSDSEYKDALQSFRMGLPNNTILGIFKLNMPTHLVKAHNDYKAKYSYPNVRAFHGTKCVCGPQRFVSNPKAEFCRSGCGACGIAQDGNKIRFSGDGKLWFANNSSVSLGYCSYGYNASYGYGKNGAYGATANTMFIVDLITNLSGPVYILDSEAVYIDLLRVGFKPASSENAVIADVEVTNFADNYIFPHINRKILSNAEFGVGKLQHISDPQVFNGFQVTGTAETFTDTFVNDLLRIVKLNHFPLMIRNHPLCKLYIEGEPCMSSEPEFVVQRQKITVLVVEDKHLKNVGYATDFGESQIAAVILSCDSENLRSLGKAPRDQTIWAIRVISTYVTFYKATITAMYWMELANGPPKEEAVKVQRWPAENGLKTGFDLAEPDGRRTVLTALVKIRESLLQEEDK
ncbi:13924_t:CDS:2, partial [Dentiscutata heterogama]